VSDPADLLTRNRTWAARAVADDADFFKRLVGQQTPHFLWLGCADSRVPANVITGLGHGEIFVHRNIANVLPHSDLNALTVLDYAVSVLKVEHVIVCGHYGCGGIAAALDGQSHGLLDNWLLQLKDVAAKHKDVLAALPDVSAREARLTELNAVEQALNVCYTSIVQKAWARGQLLTVRAWVYGLSDGILRDLRFVVSQSEELEPAYRLALEHTGAA
jgi:carbonic anhydrase